LVRQLLRPRGWLYIKAHQPESYYYWAKNKMTSRYGDHVQGMLTLPVLRNILAAESFQIISSGFFRSRFLSTRFGLSPSMLDAIVSRFAHPVLSFLGACDRFWVIARHSSSIFSLLLVCIFSAAGLTVLSQDFSSEEMLVTTDIPETRRHLKQK